MSLSVLAFRSASLSSSLTLPRKLNFDTFGHCWPSDFAFKSILPEPRLRAPPSQNKPFSSAAPMSCHEYREGSVESELLS